MGVVYLAEHPDKGWAALKFLHGANATDATFRERFRREVEAANMVRSPRVAALLDADLDAATPWLATAFVDGPTLAEAVNEGGPMEADRIVALAAALADALATIHASGVVHRDLKPANILLTPDTPVVIDFGIASAREAPALTRTGMSLGTPGWMAPEQVRGRRAGPHTDVFAWGLVVAFAGSGRPPFGRGPADVLYYRVVHQRPQLPELPEPLGELVAAALAKDPRGRPTVAELLGRLGAGVAPSPDPVDPTTTGPVPTLVAAGWGPDALPAAAAHRSAAASLAPGGAAPAGPGGNGAGPVRPGGNGAGGNGAGPARPGGKDAGRNDAGGDGAAGDGAAGVAAAGVAAGGLRNDRLRDGGPAGDRDTAETELVRAEPAPADATSVTQLDPAARSGAGNGARGLGVPPADATKATRVVPGSLGVAAGGAATGATAAAPGRNGTGAPGTGGPAAGGPGAGDSGTMAGARPGPTFWYGGAEHDTAATLAAAMQRHWDDAVDQVFVQRNPVWIADLQAFLDARGLADAERIVAYGQGTAPAGAAMARLLVALDPELEPRFGGILLTPSGLASAANAVIAGHGPAARLAEVHDNDILRLWRMLPGLEGAAAIDERWQAHTQAFDRLAAENAAEAGPPTAADRQQAVARLLLHALGGRHARQQNRQLRSAQKTPAADVGWWQRLANRGGAVPAAGVLAIMTVEAARPAGEAIRRRNAEAAAVEAARRAEQARRAEAARRAAKAPPGPYAPPPPWAGGPSTGPAAPPPVAPGAGARPAPARPRVVPRSKAHGLVHGPFGLAVAVAILGFHLWAQGYLRDELRLYFQVDRNLQALDEIEQAAPFVGLALVLAIVMHLVGRWADQGQRSGVIRLYALGAAATDAILSFAFFTTCGFAALVVEVVVSAPFAAPLPDNLIRPAWAGMGVTHTVVAFLAVWLLVRSGVRGLRALLGGSVAQRTA